jgi:DNA-binding transcriptional ArsR family regulator
VVATRSGRVPAGRPSVFAGALPDRRVDVSNVVMTPEVLALLAERFRALAEPARLQILTVLRGGERTVGDLVERTDLGQANVSKHLQLLHALGFVNRRKEGLFVYYALADRSVFQLCDIMCGRLEKESSKRRKLLTG